MAGDVARIERKLQSLVAEKSCDLCSRRIEACPSCGRPIGGMPGEGEEARARIVAEIDRLAERRARIQAQLDAVDPA